MKEDVGKYLTRCIPSEKELDIEMRSKKQKLVDQDNDDSDVL